MARTIEEIKKEMTDEFMADETIREKYGLQEGDKFGDKFSKVSIESILFYLHAVRTWVLENLFEAHLSEVSEIAERKRPHTLLWYRDKALSFQYGCSLSEDSAVYDNSGMTDDEVAETQIVKKCSAETTSAIRPTIQIKAAKEDDPLTPQELQSLQSYMSQVADAGLRVVCISGEPDVMELSITVLYDSLVIDSDGCRYIGGSYPVKETVTRHLSDLPFNGVFYPRMLESELMSQDGIKVAHVTLAKAGVERSSMTTIEESYNPYYGAIQCDVDNDLHVTYEPF